MFCARTRFTLVAAELVAAEAEHESEVTVHLVPVSAARWSVGNEEVGCFRLSEYEMTLNWFLKLICVLLVLKWSRGAAEGLREDGFPTTWWPAAAHSLYLDVCL